MYRSVEALAQLQGLGSPLRDVWHFDTLVADFQQVYDISIPNDRLVLQIKGTIAEVEYENIKTRLRMAIEAKAARGELKVLLPPGYVYDRDGQIVLHPDERVQQAIRSMF